MGAGNKTALCLSNLGAMTSSNQLEHGRYRDRNTGKSLFTGSKYGDIGSKPNSRQYGFRIAPPNEQELGGSVCGNAIGRHIE